MVIYSCCNLSKIVASRSEVMDIVSGQLVLGLELGSLRSWTFNVFSTVLDVTMVANQLVGVVEKLFV